MIQVSKLSAAQVGELRAWLDNGSPLEPTAERPSFVPYISKPVFSPLTKVMQRLADRARSGKQVGFVAGMGALHVVGDEYILEKFTRGNHRWRALEPHEVQWLNEKSGGFHYLLETGFF